MATKGQEEKGLWVSVDRVEYVVGASGPPDRPHQFVYFVTIHNDSPRAVTIMGRKWVVTNAQGHRLVIEGMGLWDSFRGWRLGSSFTTTAIIWWIWIVRRRERIWEKMKKGKGWSCVFPRFG